MGEGEVSIAGHVCDSQPCGWGTLGSPKKMEEENEVGGLVDKVAFASQTVLGEKDLLSLPSLPVLQIRKQN